jgi:hypothetical protein
MFDWDFSDHMLITEGESFVLAKSGRIPHLAKKVGPGWFLPGVDLLLSITYVFGGCGNQES